MRIPSAKPRYNRSAEAEEVHTPKVPDFVRDSNAFIVVEQKGANVAESGIAVQPRFRTSGTRSMR